MRPKVCALASTPRSGTHFLRLALNNHPQMSWTGEFFRPDSEYRSSPLYKEHFEIKDYVYGNVITPFVNKLRYVGFVWHLTLEADLAYSKVNKFILLERKHKLAQFTSLQIAVKTGFWRIPEEKPNHKNTEKIEIDIEKYFQFLDKYNSVYDEFKKNGLKYKTVYYEDLCNDFDETIKSVQEFLEVDYFEIKPGELSKQEHRPLQEIITNYEDIKIYDGFYKI